MHDPFPIPPIPWLSEAVQPWADRLHAQTLPLHIHEVIISFAFYTLLGLSSPRISTFLSPQIYPSLDCRSRLKWDTQLVSLVQSLIICSLALWVMVVDEERKAMSSEERIFGYTGALGMIQGLVTGYFLWDIVYCLIFVKIFGKDMLAHAVCALGIFLLGFMPFVNFYGPTFILYELSSPFLNIHWFMDKTGMTGTKRQLINGIFLLGSFFGSRLVWGNYQSIRVYQDIWRAIHWTPPMAGTTAALAASMKTGDARYMETMRFAGDQRISFSLAFCCLLSSATLNALSALWFTKMIAALRKRFRPELKGTDKIGEPRRDKEGGESVENYAMTPTGGVDGGVRKRRAV